MKENEMNKSFEESVEVIKRYSKSFYQAFKLLPKEKFLAVASVYAFCRAADDLADEAKENEIDVNLKKLELLHKNIENLLNNQIVNNEYGWWLAFEDSVKKFSIPSKGFFMQIEGQKTDMFFKDIESIEDLIEYSRNVAGSVGRMMLPILVSNQKDRDDTNLQIACENLGIAMQITNILRDVGEDLTLRNRMYLPKTLLNKYNLSKEKINQFIKSGYDKKEFKDFINLWEELSNISETYYDNFNKYLCKFDKDSRLPIYSSSIIYRAILDEIRDNGYNCLTRKNYTSKVKKAKLLSEAALYVKKACNE